MLSRCSADSQQNLSRFSADSQQSLSRFSADSQQSQQILSRFCCCPLTSSELLESTSMKICVINVIDCSRFLSDSRQILVRFSSDSRQTLIRFLSYSRQILVRLSSDYHWRFKFRIKDVFNHVC